MVNQSRVIMQKTDSWKEQVSFYRFRKNEHVTEKGLTELSVSHCIEQSRDIEHLLLIEDTSEINPERHRGRITDREGLGLTGNNRDLGFFCHPTIAVNAADGSLPGALDIHLWHRPENKQSKSERGCKQLPIEEKESYRRAERAIISAEQVFFANEERWFKTGKVIFTGVFACCNRQEWILLSAAIMTVK